jgi:hypothetical protein
VSSGGIDAMTAVLLKIGPLGKLVRERPELGDEAGTRLRAALTALGDTTHVEVNAAVWIVTALA